jgi:hypothetical protein
MGKNTVPVIDSSATVFAPEAPVADAPAVDHSARVLALEGELSSARDTHGAELGAVKNELAAAHSELETLREKLKHVTSERDQAHTDLASTRELLDHETTSDDLAATVGLHGATANTASPSFEDLPADHPLKTDLPTRVGEPVGDPLVSQAPGSPVANR